MARRRSPRLALLAAAAALAASCLVTAPAAASSRDTARIEVRIEDPLGNAVEGVLIAVEVDAPSLAVELRTDSYGSASARVPVAAEGSTVTVDLASADVVGEPLRVFAGVVPRDRIEVEATWRIVGGGFEPEPQNEEFYEFDADGDGPDDALYRWRRDGLPDVLAIDVDADGVDVQTERVGEGRMGLSVVDIDLDGADDVVLTGEGAAGEFTGVVWTYDPGTSGEDSFAIGAGGGWLYWSQLDAAGGLDPWWVADPAACGAGPIERILSDGTREWIEFPAEASGFPVAADFDGDAVGDLRCATFTFSPSQWTVWQWSSESGVIEMAEAAGLSSRALFEVDCDADGVDETVIPGETVVTPDGPRIVLRGFEPGGQTWESQAPESALSVSLQGPGGVCPVS